MVKFTNSRLNCLAECPQKHHRAYVQGYRLIQEDSDALNFGSAFHWLLEQYEMAQREGKPAFNIGIDSMTEGQGSQMDPFEICPPARFSLRPGHFNDPDGSTRLQ